MLVVFWDVPSPARSSECAGCWAPGKGKIGARSWLPTPQRGGWEGRRMGRRTGRTALGRGAECSSGAPSPGRLGEMGPRAGAAPVGGKELAQASAALKVHWSLTSLACLLRVPEASSDHCPAAPPASTWHSLQDVPVSARLQPAPLQRVCLGAEPAGSSSSSYHSRSTQAGGRPPPACCGPAAPPLGYNML